MLSEAAAPCWSDVQGNADQRVTEDPTRDVC